MIGDAIELVARLHLLPVDDLLLDDVASIFEQRVELMSQPTVTEMVADMRHEVIDALIKPMVYLLAPDAVRAKIHDTVHIPITGLFAVLLIFVLAQIFRRGSDMRAELAGTI